MFAKHVVVFSWWCVLASNGFVTVDQWQILHGSALGAAFASPVLNKYVTNINT